MKRTKLPIGECEGDDRPLLDLMKDGYSWLAKAGTETKAAHCISCNNLKKKWKVRGA
jgi:hypothetical protein